MRPVETGKQQSRHTQAPKRQRRAVRLSPRTLAVLVQADEPSRFLDSLAPNLLQRLRINFRGCSMLVAHVLLNGADVSIVSKKTHRSPGVSRYSSTAFDQPCFPEGFVKNLSNTPISEEPVVAISKHQVRPAGLQLPFFQHTDNFVC